MAIKGEWKEPCQECGALDGCCEAAKERSETSVSLARLVARQSETITTLKNGLQEAHRAIDDMKRTIKAAA